MESSTANSAPVLLLNDSRGSNASNNNSLTSSNNSGGAGSVADLQLATCRKLRELLPNSKDLLQTAQERNWIPVLLGWLNLRDRPAVQVEALLALTSIAELCAQQQPVFPPGTSTTNVVKAAKAAVSAVQGNSWNDAMEAAQKYAAVAAGSQAYAAAAAAAGTTAAAYNAPGSVPFPPLSFSDTLSPEAVASLDANLTQTLASLGNSSNATKTNPNWSLPPAPLFPTGAPGGTDNSSANALSTAGALATRNSSAVAPPAVGGINFTSLAPPPGGAHTSVPSNAFLPPPTPVATFGAATHPGGLSFPQQLSASSQHLLLRHQDAIPTLISLLSSPNREVYEQAMWILGSIAAGDSPGAASAAAAAAASSGSSSTAAAAAAAAAATGGSPGSFEKSVSARDVIIAAGVMNQLLRCLEAHPSNLSLQRIGAWTLSNLVDGIFQQSNHKGNSSSSGGGMGNNTNSNSGGHHHHHHNHNYNSQSGNSSGGSSSGNKNSSEYSSSDEIDMRTLLPVLRRLLRSADPEVLSYTCWTLSHLCDGPASHIAAVVTTPSNLKNSKPGGLVPRLVELLTHLSWRVTKPALRTIGNIVCAECTDDTAAVASGIAGGTTTDYTEVILECNAVPRLKELVTHTNREIQKEACWTLSNIAAGTVEQIQSVIDAGCIPPLVKLVQDGRTDQEVRSEACWVVLNATSCGSDSQIEGLVNEGCVAVLGVLLSEASMVMMALEGLERVLQVEETRELIRCEQIESGDILEDDEETKTPTLVSASLIEKAREGHNNPAVTKRADRIWKQHFVSCALCTKSFSRHRPADASFCNECKCYVCASCNCNIYHLDYQEELWAESEKTAEVKKNAKSKKNKKKKEKLKQKKAKQLTTETAAPAKQEQTVSSTENNSKKDEAGAKNEALAAKSKAKAVNTSKNAPKSGGTSSNTSFDDEEACDAVSDSVVGADNDAHEANNQIDFVLYLQQTGSIIALAKLMDALEYGGGGDGDFEILDDYERKMISEQKQILRERSSQPNQ